MSHVSTEPWFRRALGAACVACLVVLAPTAARANDDLDAPVITHTVASQVAKGLVAVEFRVTDASNLYGVLFHWRHVGEPVYQQLDYPTTQASYTAQFVVTRDFEFWIEAYDELGNGPGLDGTAELPHLVRVVETHLVTETLTARRLPDGVTTTTEPEPSGDWQPPEGSLKPFARTRVGRVPSATALEAGVFEIRGEGLLGYGSDFLLPGASLFGQDLTLDLSYGIVDWLQVSAGSQVRHTSLTHSMVSAGDPRFAARAVTGDLGAARLGVEGTLEVAAGVDRDPPAGDCVTATGAACPAPGFVVSPGVKGFASLEVSSLRLHFNLGYRWDNSEALLPGRWSDFTTYALGLSRFDQLSFALAAEYSLGKLKPFVEWTLEVPVDRRSFNQCKPDGDTRTCGPDRPLFPAAGGQMPQRLGLGTSYEVSSQLAVDGSLELSLASASRGLTEPGVLHLLALEGLAPAPPVAFRFNVAWRFDLLNPQGQSKPKETPEASAIDPDFTW